MKKRTQIKAELADLAENIGSKSNTEAASAVLELYKEFALLAAEEHIQVQINDIKEDLKAQLQARIAAIQSQTEVVPKETALKNASYEEDNQLSLVDVAEEIEKEKAAKAAESDTDKLVLKEDIGIDDVEIDEEEITLHENQSSYIPIGSKHRLSNPGKITLKLIEVQSGSYLGEDDIERFEDNYGRLNKK